MKQNIKVNSELPDDSANRRSSEATLFEELLANESGDDDRNDYQLKVSKHLTSAKKLDSFHHGNFSSSNVTSMEIEVNRRNYLVPKMNNMNYSNMNTDLALMKTPSPVVQRSEIQSPKNRKNNIGVQNLNKTPIHLCQPILG